MKYLSHLVALGPVLGIALLLCSPTMAQQGHDMACSSTVASPCSSNSSSTDNSNRAIDTEPLALMT